MEISNGNENETTLTLPWEGGNGTGGEGLGCGCDVILQDLVLPPYFVIFLSILTLTGLSLLINAAELKVRYGLTTRQIRTMAGTATLSALAAPPWWFLAPQAAYHIAHLGYIIYQAIENHSASLWEEYELGYAVWVNGGATIFMVFGVAGSKYTMLMIKGERKLAEELMDPRSELGTDVDADNFRKQFLQVTVVEMEEIQAKSEEKAKVMGDPEEWQKGLKVKQRATMCLVACLLPAIFTHIGPGFIGYCWVFLPLCIPVHFVCMKLLVPRSRYLTLIWRIVLLDSILAIYAIAIQDSFNFALSFYNGEQYLSLVPRTVTLHDTRCFFCTMFRDVGSVLNAVSLA